MKQYFLISYFLLLLLSSGHLVHGSGSTQTDPQDDNDRPRTIYDIPKDVVPKILSDSNLTEEDLFHCVTIFKSWSELAANACWDKRIYIFFGFDLYDKWYKDKLPKAKAQINFPETHDFNFPWKTIFESRKKIAESLIQNTPILAIINILPTVDPTTQQLTEPIIKFDESEFLDDREYIENIILLKERIDNASKKHNYTTPHYIKKVNRYFEKNIKPDMKINTEAQIEVLRPVKETILRLDSRGSKEARENRIRALSLSVPLFGFQQDLKEAAALNLPSPTEKKD
jgi:hypothetical protein